MSELFCCSCIQSCSWHKGKEHDVHNYCPSHNPYPVITGITVGEMNLQRVTEALLQGRVKVTETYTTSQLVNNPHQVQVYTVTIV